MKHLIQFSFVAVVSSLLVGCVTPPSDGVGGSKPTSTPSVSRDADGKVLATTPSDKPPVAPPTVPVEPSTSEKNLAAGLASYERGEYVAAMRLLSPLTNDATLDITSRLLALKSLAFSQCLTRAVVACRGTFERAFKLDPKFDLAPAEQGHPVWGPQFEIARKKMKIN